MSQTSTAKSCPPPDPNPSKPLNRLPVGAWDAHCHVFGPAAKFPYSAGRSYTPEDAPFERLRALHAHLGFTRAVIVHASCHGTDHRVTLDAIARSGGAYRGVANGEAELSDAALAELHAGGMRGLRFNFVKHLGGVPDVTVLTRMAKRIAALGWHLELHLDAQDLVEQAELIRSIEIPFVIDHMGRAKASAGLNQKPFQMLLALMRENPLAWVKISGPERVSGVRPFRDAVPFARALVEAAPDRILWGTDWPHPNISQDMPNDGALVDLFFEAVPDAALRNKIVIDNPARLYAFD